MILLGLTGGIGMGKSTAAGFFEARSVKVIDTDLLAREVVQSGKEAYQELIHAFGVEILEENGSINRRKLAEIAFKNEPSRRVLETIVHPPIRAEWERAVEGWRENNVAVGMVVIPLLFETGAQKAFSAIICLACTRQTQRERLRERGWSEEHIQLREGAQWPVEKKVEASNYVLWSEGRVEVLEEQAEACLRNISQHQGPAGVA